MCAGRRLSENPSVSVLLLEAGPPDTADEIHIPAALNLLFQSSYDWGFRTVPQDRAAGQSVYWPRGRVVGGSSSINAMIYIRGNKHDYNTWRDEYGCDGWGYNDLLPYFIRAEGNARGSSAYHGGSGPLSVVDPKFKSPSTSAFVESAVNAGAIANPDFNGQDQDGVGFYQVTQKEGRRWSAADAYLHPAQGQAEPDRADRRAGHLGRDRRRPCRRRPLPAPGQPSTWPGPRPRSSCPAARSTARSC